MFNKFLKTFKKSNKDNLIKEDQYRYKAKLYKIDLDQNDWCEFSDLHMFDAIVEWEKLLKQALFVGADWKMNEYDPKALELEIERIEELYSIEAREERHQANKFYYSERGC